MKWRTVTSNLHDIFSFLGKVHDSVLHARADWFWVPSPTSVSLSPPAHCTLRPEEGSSAWKCPERHDSPCVRASTAPPRHEVRSSPPSPPSPHHYSAQQVNASLPVCRLRAGSEESGGPSSTESDRLLEQPVRSSEWRWGERRSGQPAEWTLMKRREGCRLPCCTARLTVRGPFVQIARCCQRKTVHNKKTIYTLRKYDPFHQKLFGGK